MTQSCRYARCLPYLNNISAGTIRIGTTYCRTMFIGTPNISRLRNRPKIFRITAAARTAKRSSASRPKKVTRVLRFRYPGVTSSGIVFPPLRHPACALRDEEFPEPKKTGEHQAKPCGREMSHQFAGRMKMMVHSQTRRPRGNL